MQEDLKILNYDPSPVHMTLYSKIHELTGAVHRSLEDTTQKALSYLSALSDAECVDALKRASLAKIEIDSDLTVPKTIKVHVRTEDCAKVDSCFRAMAQPVLRRIQRPFYMRLILMGYYQYLLSERSRLEVQDLTLTEKEGVDNLERFSVSVAVSEMLLKNSPQDHLFIQEVIQTMARRKKGTKNYE